MQKQWSKKQIPTIAGIGVLLVALVAGIVVLPKVTDFSPRATPQTTPKNIQISNVKDTSASVFFLTDESTSGFVKYGTAPDQIKLQASDDRDQVSGNVGQYSTHYITLRDLQPDTDYYYTLGTGSVSKYDNDGQPFLLRTSKRGGSPTAAKTIYGTVNAANGVPAEGAVVFVNIDGVGMLSSLVKSTGSWAIPLSTARVTDGSKYASILDTTPININVQGTLASQLATAQTTVAEAQPVSAIALSEGGGTQNPSSMNAETQSDTTQPLSSPLVDTTLPIASDVPASSSSPISTTTTSTTETVDATSMSIDTILKNLQTETQTTTTPLSPIQSNTQTVPVVEAPTSTTVDMKATAPPVVDTTQPAIVGQAPANTLINIEVHSQEQITTQLKTDATGNYVFDLSEAEKYLEPGEHTATVTYTDPKTGQLKTETKTFTVQPKNGTGTTATATSSSSALLAQIIASPTPYGTNNPYVIPSPSPLVATSASTFVPPRVVMPATSSALPTSGSVGTTIAVFVAGVFFILAGLFSYYQAHQIGAHYSKNNSAEGDDE